MSKIVEEHGWTPVPRSLDKVVNSRKDPQPPKAVTVDDFPPPTSPLVQTVTKYARENLPQETFNHSMRVYYYGQAILKAHFPSFRLSPETWLLTCLLHDIGTTATNMRSTHLSFEFQGGYKALDLLSQNGSPQAQAEAVAEAIIRHQDCGETGMIAQLGFLIQIATLVDNTAAYAELVNTDTIRNVVGAWPRLKWSSCFASSVRKEVELKPYSHTTKIENFAEMIEDNELMKKWE
ncbi:hypothetical protein AAFC00_005394 [Neodothiora populina]|uniref:HD domain-containing protein n=1 Tax=Neodothiora populina TaxID=2781224 RepID=A0ABR3PKR4_9PEZI